MCERSGGRAGQKRAHTLDEQGAQAAQWNSQQSAVRYEGSTSTGGPLKVNGLIKKVDVSFYIETKILTFSRRSL